MPLFSLIHSQRAGTTSNAQSAVDRETEAKLQSISDSYAQSKDKVVNKLLDRVVLIKPELHRNLKKIDNR
jgi:V-type H+-transporting ATPase subunit G